MHTVRIYSVEVVDAIDLKNRLIQDGLILDHDFEWSWITADYNDVEGWIRHKHAEFQFQDPALATFYRLKWAQ